MSSPLFSIIIPSYNRAHIVPRSIRSCLGQTCQDFEIIVVDDEKSTDDIEAAVAAFGDPRIRVVTNHRGTAAAARNTGVRLAKGRYAAFLDSDDEFLPDKLAACHEHLRGRDCHCCYSQTYVDRGVGRLWVKPRRGLREDEDILDYLFIEKGWMHSSTVVLDAELARHSPYREDLSFGDDMQFAVDLWRRGIRFGMIHRPLAVYEDFGAADRLSQSPVFRPAAATEHRAFVAWLETQRPHMSERAYLACRAFFLSRFVARDEPAVALAWIWGAYRRGAVTAPAALAQSIQTFAPRLYRRFADSLARRRGIEPPEAVRQLREREPAPGRQPEERRRAAGRAPATGLTR